MATQNDTHDQGGGFWSCATLLLGLGFAGFALVAGSMLVYGGMSRPGKDSKPAAAPAAPAAASTSDVAVIEIKPDTTNPLAYNTKSFTVKSGQKVKLTFNNQSTLPQPHNLIVGKLGSKDRLIAAATAMMTNPNGMALGYIPESQVDIIIHTKLLNPGQSETLEFSAPAEKGEYPYLCSFPGHSLIMNGVMRVE